MKRRNRDGTITDELSRKILEIGPVMSMQPPRRFLEPTKASIEYLASIYSSRLNGRGRVSKAKKPKATGSALPRS